MDPRKRGPGCKNVPMYCWPSNSDRKDLDGHVNTSSFSIRAFCSFYGYWKRPKLFHHLEKVLHTIRNGIFIRSNFFHNMKPSSSKSYYSAPFPRDLWQPKTWTSRKRWRTIGVQAPIDSNVYTELVVEKHRRGMLNKMADKLSVQTLWEIFRSWILREMVWSKIQSWPPLSFGTMSFPSRSRFYFFLQSAFRLGPFG